MLGYFELPKDEVPDEDIWHHTQRLEEWFEAVEQRRRNGMEPTDAPEDVDMTSNQLTRDLLKD